ncbi:EAL domain-containing protein [Xanthobacteraceae bacterium A53D]
MRRRTIILVAILLAIIAAATPLVIGTYLARDQARESARRYLTEYADWTLQRTRQTLQGAEAALKAAAAIPQPDCGPAHIARMRELTIDNSMVDSMAYLKDGRLLCTAWGVVDTSQPTNQPAMRIADDMVLAFGVRPSVSPNSEMLSLRRGNYGVLIRPDRTVDVLRDTSTTLGIATAEGRLIAQSGKADPHLVQRLTRATQTGHHDGHLFASVRSPDLTAFAIMDEATALEDFKADLTFLIPTALAVSCVLVALIIWVSRQRLSIRHELQMAIRRGEFVAHYQPLIMLATGRCIGAEALIRWRRPDGVAVAPDTFVPLAEQHGLISQITEVMIRRVVADLAGMLRADPSLHISINLSASDLHSGRFLPDLWKALKQAGIPNQQIWLEATEHSFIDAEAARSTIELARAAGHRVAIDDFGTGYSSLALLETLPLDALKIDRSFVAAIGTQAARSVVMPHIIEMAAGLDLKLVAEGVETLEQQAYLRAAGVHYAQGWLYAKAMPPDAFAEFCAAHNRQPALSA